MKIYLPGPDDTITTVESFVEPTSDMVGKTLSFIKETDDGKWLRVIIEIAQTPEGEFYGVYYDAIIYDERPDFGEENKIYERQEGPVQ